MKIEGSDEVFRTALARLRRREKRAIWSGYALTLTAAIIGLSIVVYSRNEVTESRRVVQSLEAERISLHQNNLELKQENLGLTRDYKRLLDDQHRLAGEIETIRTEKDGLETARNTLIDFMASFGRGANSWLHDESPEWEEIWRSIRAKIVAQPPGARQSLVLGALLMSWRDIQFSLNGNSLRSGFNSPSFISFLLKNVGVEIEKERGKRLSTTLMREFPKTESPHMGDLVFYRGIIGNFGCIYLTSGHPDGDGICIGIIGDDFGVRIFDTAILEQQFEFRGYFAVPYDD